MLRYGFTTGSCAAAAAKAAAYMLLTGREKTEIVIETPKGIPYRAKLTDIVRGEREARADAAQDRDTVRGVIGDGVFDLSMFLWGHGNIVA